MLTPEEIRAEQEKFALDQLKEEGVEVANLPMTPPRTSRPTLKMPKLEKGEIDESQSSSARKGDVQKNRPKNKSSKGHYACLAKIVSERRHISIILKSGGEKCSGELLEFDDEALRIRLAGGNCEWFFKHAIESFSEEVRKEALQ